MKRLPSGRLLDLLATTESVGDDQRVRGGFTHARQKHAFADAHGDVVVLALEAERAGHPAAAGIEMSPVVEWAPAAEWLFRDDDVISGAAKHFRCRNRRLRTKVIVERVGP